MDRKRYDQNNKNDKASVKLFIIFLVIFFILPLLIIQIPGSNLIGDHIINVVEKIIYLPSKLI